MSDKPKWGPTLQTHEETRTARERLLSELDDMRRLALAEKDPWLTAYVEQQRADMDYLDRMMRLADYYLPERRIRRWYAWEVLAYIGFGLMALGLLIKLLVALRILPS